MTPMHRLVVGLALGLLLAGFLAPGSTTPFGGHDAGAVLPRAAAPLPHAPAVPGTARASASGGLPIGVAAGEVAATLAPWANYSASGYHKISGDPAYQGPLVYDPLDHDFWVGGNSQNYYNVPDPVLLVNATTLRPAGLMTSVTNAGPMIFDPGNGIMYISEIEGSTVLQVNAATGKAAGPAIDVGQTPGALALNPYQGLLYVANSYNDSIEAVSTATASVVAYSAALSTLGAQYPGGPTWTGLAYDPQAHCVVSALSNNGFLDWLNGTTLYNRTGYHLGTYGDTVYTVVIDPSGNAWATSWYYPDTTTQVANLTHIISTATTAWGVTDSLYDAALGMVIESNPSWDSISFFSTANDSFAYAYYYAAVFGSSYSFEPGYLALGPGSSELYSLDGTTLTYPYSSSSYPEPAGSTVAEFSVTTGALLTESPPLEGNPTSLVFDPAAGEVVAADAYSQNLTFISATDPLALPDRTVYYNGSAGALAYDPLTRTLWLPLEISTWLAFDGAEWSPGDVLEVLNATTGAVVQTILPWGQGEEVEVTWAGYDAATGTMVAAGVSYNDGDGFVAEFNARTGAPVGTVLNVGDIGYGGIVPNAAIDPIGNQLYFAPGTGEAVLVVNLTSISLTATLTVGNDPFGLAFDPVDGTMYVTNTGSYNMTLINATRDVVVVPAVDLDGLPTYEAYDPSTQLIYVGVERDVGPTPSDLETTLVVLNGTSVPAVWGQWPTIYTGYSAPVAPSMAVYVPSSLPGTPGEVWNSNLYDGSITVISVPPAVASFWASPDDLEVGEPLVLTATAFGGADGVTPSYAGLPPGCTSAPTWTLSCTPTSAGTFQVTLTITDGIGLAATQSLTLAIAPALQLPGSLTPGVVDAGETVWGNVTPEGGVAPYTVSWSFGDAATGTGDDVAHTFAAAGLYEVRATVTDALGLVGSFGGAVQVNPAPSISVSASSRTGTEGTSLSFAASLRNGTEPYSTISWNFGDGTATATGSLVSHTFSKAGAFKVNASATDARGVAVSASTTVTVSAPGTLALSLTLGANLTATGTPISLVAEASGGIAPYTYAWSVDGSPAGTDSDTLTYTPSGPGTYTISVTVTDATGATATRGTTLTVQSPPSSTSGSLASDGGFTGLGLLIGAVIGIIIGYVLARRRHDRKEKLTPTEEKARPLAPITPSSETDQVAPKPGESSSADAGQAPPAAPPPADGKLPPLAPENAGGPTP